MKTISPILPGQPVRGSKTGVPVMALLDLLGRNWAMGIVWYLSQETCTFRKLRSKCESISPTTLNKRLKELTAAQLVTRTIGGYTLTKEGQSLAELLLPLNDWANEWAATITANTK